MDGQSTLVWSLSSGREGLLGVSGERAARPIDNPALYKGNIDNLQKWVMWLNRMLRLYIPVNNGTSNSKFILHSGCHNPQWYIAKRTSCNSLLLNVSCKILFQLIALLQTFTVMNWGRANGSVKKLTEFWVSVHTWLLKTIPIRPQRRLHRTLAAITAKMIGLGSHINDFKLREVKKLSPTKSMHSFTVFLQYKSNVSHSYTESLSRLEVHNIINLIPLQWQWLHEVQNNRFATHKGSHSSVIG
jgi:hypothetical protein